MMSDEALAALLVEGRLAILTDRFAPVDQMQAPVFRNEIPAPAAAGN